MDEIGLFEAKNKLSELVDRAERGEEVVITRRGKPVAGSSPCRPNAMWRRRAPQCKRIRRTCEVYEPRSLRLGRMEKLSGRRQEDNERTRARQFGHYVLVSTRRKSRHQRKKLLEDVGENGAVVPSLWRLEVRQHSAASTTAKSNQSARIVRVQLRRSRTLPIELDTETRTEAWNATFRLGRAISPHALRCLLSRIGAPASPSARNLSTKKLRTAGKEPTRVLDLARRLNVLHLLVRVDHRLRRPRRRVLSQSAVS